MARDGWFFFSESHGRLSYGVDVHVAICKLGPMAVTDAHHVP